ncbi:MAG: MFS transporter [Reyranellaceae bacterium]
MTRSFNPRVAILLAASSVTIMAGAVVAPALPAMREHYAGLPNAAMLVVLVMTLPGLVIAVASPFMGLVADLFGRSRVLVFGLALFVASGASGYLLDSLYGILVGRVLVGLAVACVMTAATALLVDLTEGMARNVVIGQQIAATGIGGLVFPLLAGVLTQYDWRAAFLAYLLPIILVPLAWSGVKDVIKPAQAPPSSLAEFPVARGVITYALAVLGMIVLYAIPLQIPYALSNIGDASPVLSGLQIGIASFSAAIWSLLFGKLRARFSPIVLVAISFGAMAIGYLIVSRAPDIVVITIGLVVAGAGFGINLPNLSSWLQESVPFGLRGRAAGGLTSAVALGQFVSTFAYSAIGSERDGASSFLLATGLCVIVVATAVLSLVARKAAGTMRPKVP